MPYRYYTREQDWLLPPSLSELLPRDHLARFVAEFVDGVDLAEAGIEAQPAIEGAPAFALRLLLGAWIYGFMTHVRSSRKLERACRENIPLMWLTAMQHPDHVTLWRFYKQHRKGMRKLLKLSVRRAVEAGLVDFELQALDGCRVAVTSGDSLRGRAALEKWLAQVEAEIAAMEQAERHAAGGVVRPAKSGKALQAKQALRARLQRALEIVKVREARKAKRAQKAKQIRPGAKAKPAGPKPAAGAAETGAESTDSGQPGAASQPGAGEAVAAPDDGMAQVAAVASGEEPATTVASDSPVQASQPDGRPAEAAGPLNQASPAEGKPAAPASPAEDKSRRSRKRVGPLVCVSDPAAVLMKGRHGYVVGYNGQAVVDSKAQIIVAADVVANAYDVDQLPPMLEEARAMSGRQAKAVVGDKGFFDISKIVASQQSGIEIYVPDPREGRADAPERNPFHKSHFTYDAASDTYRCPEGQRLTFRGEHRWKSRLVRAYEAKDCRGCPFQHNQACTKAKARSLAIHGFEVQLQAHADKMQTDAAKAILRRRCAIVEPVFGLLREQLGLLRFLVRGLENVKGEWWLTCSAHNLRKLWKLVWRPKVLGPVTS